MVLVSLVFGFYGVFCDYLLFKLLVIWFVLRLGVFIVCGFVIGLLLSY